MSQINQIIDSYQSVHPEFSQNISISGKVTIIKKEEERTLYSNIHIQPGQKILVNAYFLGFPVARALITPNEVAAYEKIQKTYLKSDFSLANRYLKTDFFDYTQLERLFLGKSLFKLDGENYQLLQNRTDNLYILASKSDILLTHTEKNVKGYIHSLEIDGNLCIRKESVKKADSPERLIIIYDDWKKVDNQLFPEKVHIFVNEKSHPVFSIEATRIKTNSPMNTSFYIPEEYKERNW
ncbi:MAG: DUF4292 domain-containing protein [Flavobacteriales bacterium Tduv]